MAIIVLSDVVNLRIFHFFYKKRLKEKGAYYRASGKKVLIAVNDASKENQADGRKGPILAEDLPYCDVSKCVRYVRRA
jgi:hypothetical protein